MFAHKHYRALSLLARLKGRPDGGESPNVQSSSGSSPRSVDSYTEQKDTPKMVVCVLEPLRIVLTETDEPSPVAVESETNLAFAIFDECCLRVFNKSIRRLPAKRKLTDRREPIQKPELPSRQEHLRSSTKVTKPQVSLLWKGRQSPRKTIKQEKQLQLEAHCAVLIQKIWRGWRVRKVCAEQRKRRGEKAVAFVRGWKCRRIMRLSVVAKTISKIRNAGVRASRAWKRELIEQIDSLWEGDWAQLAKVSRKKLSTHCQPSAVLCFTPDEKRRQQRQQYSSTKTEESVASTEESCSWGTPAKSCERSLPQCRISGHRSLTEPHDPVLQEFLYFEKRALEESAKPLSLRLVPVKTDEAQWKSVIPKLEDDSAFVLSLRRIEHVQVFKELKDLLEREFAVLRQCANSMRSRLK